MQPQYTGQFITVTFPVDQRQVKLEIAPYPWLVRAVVAFPHLYSPAEGVLISV